MSLIVQQIGPKCVPKVFPQVRNLIASGLEDTDDCTAEDAKGYLERGEWQLYAAFNTENEIKGVYVTTINYSPTGKIAVIISAAGSGLASQEVFGQLCEAFKVSGATKVQALAKESAARLYKRVGFKNKAILVEKTLWVE
jgi:hypothetical protein